MLTETGVEGFLSLTNILLPTVTTVDEVDDIGVFAGDIGVDFHDFRGCLGSDKFASLDKLQTVVLNGNRISTVNSQVIQHIVLVVQTVVLNENRNSVHLQEYDFVLETAI